MYKIVKTNGVELGTTDSVVYIRAGNGGSFTLATADDAIGVSYNSTPYNLIGHNEIADTDTVNVIKVDAGQKIDSHEAAINEMILKLLEG